MQNESAPPFWEADVRDWLEKKVASAANDFPGIVKRAFYSNLLQAVTSFKVVEVPVASEDQALSGNDEAAAAAPPSKKRKAAIRRKLQDPFHIWFQKSTDDGLWDEDQDDIPDTPGGILAVLSVGGFLNGITAKQVSETAANPNPKALFKTAVESGLAKELAQAFAGATVLQLHAIAVALHNAVAEQVKSDILRTTPLRIQALLAADLSKTEFASIRKRVYETCVLGKGIHQADNDVPDLPTAGNSAVHDIEKYKKCNICGNNEESDFVLDRKNGDVICSKCGTVVSESLMHEGSQFRKFEGEVDRNHHGDAANPLLSNAFNMGTSLSGVVPQSGAGMGGFGSGGGNKRNLETILKNAHAYTELNVSQFGKTDRRTRVGYKDRQKKDAFLQMTHAGDALNLHEAVVQRAKELFAGFRDDRELVQQFKGVLAACLCEAFEQLSAEGKHVMQQQQQQQDQQNDQRGTDGQQPKQLSARAARRNELHHANLAGKGGLLLNQEESKDDDDTESKESNEKPAAAWDLEDCRSWLLEASRNIAQSWVNEHKKNSAAAKNLPTGPLEEIEGQLVEHSITLCEHLESELQSRASTSSAAAADRNKRVITPRVTDMSKLGIKWQHSHERGSGGKGGVGGSGHGPTAAAKRTTNGRTAGQILILKTAKKLGVLLNDPVAGEAFHRELRAVVGRQEERKRKELRHEATRQRLHQMQRKPWLQARVQQ